jgi:hypothetical protein
LGTFLPFLFRIGDRRAGLQTAECIVENAVSVKIDLAPVCRCDEPKLSCRIDPGDPAGRCRFMMLDLPLKPPDAILELAARTLERIVQRKVNVGEALVDPIVRAMATSLPRGNVRWMLTSYRPPV